MLDTYLDFNATTPLRDEVCAAMVEHLGPPSNPSSVHGFGQRARLKIEEARQAVAALAGARPEEVVFTSGGTEANAMALMRPHAALAVSAVEHAAVMECADTATQLPVHANGVVDLTALEGWLAKQEEGATVAVMAANNETGAIQPVAEVVELARNYGARVHCDAVQALGKIPLNFTALGVDTMALSAHKIGGPSGIGALILKEGMPANPLTRGGGQEKNRRPGTENIIGIIGFGVAASLASPQDFTAHCQPLQQHLEDRLSQDAPDAVIHAKGAARLANTTCISMPGKLAETQVMALDLAGIAVSAGAACSSGKVKSSHVLDAMGAGEMAGNAIRVSTGLATTKSDIDRLAEAWLKLYKQA